MNSMNRQQALHILGLSAHSSEDDVKKAYRELAKKHHPDRGGNHNTFVQIQEAYDTLTKNGKNSDGYVSPEDLFRDMFGRGGPGPFEHIFRNFHPGKNRYQPPMPEISVSLEELYRGGNINRNVDMPQPCSDCRGLGRKGDDCVYCRGTGFEEKPRERGYIVVIRNPCGYCNGTGKSQPCSCNNGFINININVNINLPHGSVASEFVIQNGDSHLKVNVVIPPDMTITPDGFILYQPSVELIDIIRGKTREILGLYHDIKPFQFDQIALEQRLIYKPVVVVSDPSLFSQII